MLQLQLTINDKAKIIWPNENPTLHSNEEILIAQQCFYLKNFFWL